MKKKFSGIMMLALQVVFFAFIFTGCIPTDENGFQYLKSGQEYTFYIGESFSVEMTEVVIPSEYKGKPVTRITEGFYNNYHINDDGWTTGQTNKIKSITIPASVKEIMAGAFRDCTELEEIIISSNNPVYKADGNCVIEITTNVIIATCAASVVPNDIYSFATGAFNGMYMLNNAGEDGVLYVNNWAVGYKENLIATIEIAPATIGISNHAFYGWTKLEGIVLPSYLVSIGYEAFHGCNSLTSIFIPLSVEYIANYAFNYCDSLTIYTEATEKPTGWSENWNWKNTNTVVWGERPD